MLLSLKETTTTTKKTNKHTNKQQQNKQKQQKHIIAPVYITGGDAVRQLLGMIKR